MARHLHIDPFSGIAGDMFLGAMIDLGVSLQAIDRTLAALEIEQRYELKANRVQRHGIGAIDFQVVVDEMPEHAHGHEDDPNHDHGHGRGHTHDHDRAHGHGHEHHHGHHHHHIGYRRIMAMIDRLALGERGKARAQRVVTALGRAEARVHDKSIEKIHFHEVGAVDSLVDMLGSVVALELMEIATVSCGPLPVSRGLVRCAHGMMPVPAPATAYLMENAVTIGVDRTGELVTPTGAALVAGLVDQFGLPPAMRLEKVGYGAGDRQDEHVPNLLRLMMGRKLQAGSPGPRQALGAGDERL